MRGEESGKSIIKFLASPAEGAYLTSQSGGLPSSPAQIGQPVLKQAESAKWYNVFANNLKYGQLRPLNPQWYTASSYLYTQISNAIAGKVTPAQALSTAAHQVDQALAQNG